MNLDLFRAEIPADLHAPERSFVIVDTETTGIFPYGGDRLLEVAAVRYCGGVSIAIFSSLIHPGRSIPADSTQVHGIRDDMIVRAPCALDVLRLFREFAGYDTLVFQNARFDLGFINSELRRAALPRLGNPVIDTRLMARVVWPDLPGHGLDRLAARAGVRATGDRHRALGDAMLTLDIFRVLLDETRRVGIRTMQDLLARCSMLPPRPEPENGAGPHGSVPA